MPEISGRNGRRKWGEPRSPRLQKPLYRSYRHLDARIVFRLGKTQVDKKMVKISDVGQREDWGAGRVVTAVIENIRVGYDHGKSVIHDSRQSK
jgi:hypothetical protein